MTAWRAIALASLLAMSVDGARGQTQESYVLLRATGEIPNAELVDKVALHAEPTTLTPASLPKAEQLTVRQIATLLCGAEQPGYIGAVGRENDRPELVADDVLGAAAYQLRWPACLKVKIDEKYEIREGDTLTSIRLYSVGVKANDQALREYFKESGVTYEQRDRLPQKAIQLPFTTDWTRVRPRVQSISALIDAIKGLNVRLAEREAVSGNGRLIGPARGNAGQIQLAESDCVSSNRGGYPFNAEAVAEAFKWSRELAASQAPTAVVAVIDNGFFGVACNGPDCEAKLADKTAFVERFPWRAFAPIENYLAGSAIVGPRYGPAYPAPINYITHGRGGVHEVSGHGTHVAGLVLGGDAFLSQRRVFMDGTKSGIQLSIVGVADGTEYMTKDSEQHLLHLFDYMDKPHIANLSVSFDSRASGTISSQIKSLIEENKETLFVVAAGNAPPGMKGTNLRGDRYFPAALGGYRSLGNLLVVASHDADGSLSSFSNYGDPVDITAPGCRILSWLDEADDAVPVSGTSQAAPIVSFVAALLKNSWSAAKPQSMKNRLIYSGDLLPESNRGSVSSFTRLNAWKALLHAESYVRFTGPPEARIEEQYLGTMEPFSGLTCDSDEMSFETIAALKRDGPAVYAYASPDRLRNKLAICKAKLDSIANAEGTPNVLKFMPRWRVVGTAILKIDPPRNDPIDIPADDLIEFIRDH